MKICTNCTYTVKNGPVSDSIYCPGCGNQLVLDPGYLLPVAAPRFVRFCAGLIDCLISLVFVAIAGIPVVGIIAAPLDCLFWLLRDIKGSSPGKLILGLEVRTQGGSLPTQGALMLRNLPFAPLIIQAIPVFGNAVLPIIGIIMLIEALLVLITDRRMGDYMAGTKVMRKSTGTVKVRSAAAGIS